MYGRLLALFSRACVGILLILNGPVNVLAIGLVSVRSSCSCSQETASDEKQSCKKCCGRCSNNAQAKAKAKGAAPQDDSNNIRPTCPKCPSCPNFPSGCCVSCPCKTPCPPPLVFVIPESPELVWRLADVNTSFSDYHADVPILPHRFSQFVAINI